MVLDVTETARIRAAAFRRALDIIEKEYVKDDTCDGSDLYEWVRTILLNLINELDLLAGEEV